MSLKVLCAGCSKEERELAETQVKAALGDRAVADAWTVSLVKMTGRWSVTLDAPAARLRGLTVVAAEGRLAEAILDALRGGVAAPGGRQDVASRPPAVLPQGGRVRCESCSQAFTVQYDSQPDEPQEAAPVACPHCWKINRVMIGADAAATRDYRAEKL